MGRGAWYAAQLERARERRRQARAGRSCGYCGASLDALPATARWCGVPCRKAADYRRHRPSSVRPRGPRAAPGPRRPRRELPPVPVLERCELVDAALAQLLPSERGEVGTAWDSGALDLVAEYVLAALEGADPLAAMRAARRRRTHDRLALVHGTVLVTGLER